MDSISVPIRGFLLSYLFQTPRQNTSPDIEMGLLPAARYAQNGTLAQAQAHASTLLTLPLEMKEKIYGFVLVSTDKVVWKGEFTTGKSRSHAGGQKYICNNTKDADSATASEQTDTNIYSLLLTCRTIQSEAAATFYRGNKFVFPCRTASQRHRVLKLLLPADYHPRAHTLASGLPRAFKNQLFIANVRHITFSCANVAFERVQDHICVRERTASDRFGEVRSLCPALGALDFQEPDVEPGMPLRDEKFWFCPRLFSMGWWLWLLVMGCVALPIAIAIIASRTD